MGRIVDPNALLDEINQLKMYGVKISPKKFDNIRKFLNSFGSFHRNIDKIREEKKKDPTKLEQLVEVLDLRTRIK